MLHVHNWRVYKKKVLGFRSKRDDKQSRDVHWYLGDVVRCQACPRLEFVPDDPYCRRVEVRLATLEEIRDAEARTAA